MLTSRDGKVSVDLCSHTGSFKFVDDPYVLATPSGSTLRWSNFFNKIATSDPKSTSFTASQTAFTVTATSGVFQSTDVDRLIVFDSGFIAVITAYTSATVVTVDVSQTVAATTARVCTTLGKVSGKNNYTLVTVVKPEFVANTDNKSPTPFGVRSVRSNGAYVDYYGACPREAADVNGYNQYRTHRITGNAGSGLDSGPGDVQGNVASDGWQVYALTQQDTAFSFFRDGTTKALTNSSAANTGLNNIGVPGHLYTGASVNVDLDGQGNGVGWSMCSVATVMLFSPALTQQEILDLYGMLKYGTGYAVSRKNLVLWWLCRQDAVTASQVYTLPGAGGVFDTPRAGYALPDQSGWGNDARLYSQSPYWVTLLGQDSGIYVPRVWFDDNLVYDNSYNHTKKTLTVNSNGYPTLS